MRTFLHVLLLAAVAALVAQPTVRRRTPLAAVPTGARLLRPMRLPLGLPSEDLLPGVRDEEGNEDLLVRRVQGVLHAAAGMPPLLRPVPAAAPLRQVNVRQEAGQKDVPGGRSRLQVRGAIPLPTMHERFHTERDCRRPRRAAAGSECPASADPNAAVARTEIDQDRVPLYGPHDILACPWQIGDACPTHRLAAVSGHLPAALGSQIGGHRGGCPVLPSAQLVILHYLRYNLQASDSKACIITRSPWANRGIGTADSELPGGE